jgi:hypothetical protein
MANYNQVLTQVHSLSLPEQIKLLEELKTLVNESLDDDDEYVSSEELQQSESAWEDYISGKDKGISFQELKRQFLGKDFA